ncbi:MAG: primosomal protein N' [bacterium]
MSETASPEDADAALCVQVALSVPRLQTLTYGVPEALAGALVPGMRVMVPLGRRRMTGYVVEPPRRVAAGGMELRDVIAPLEDEPALTGELIGLTQWVAEYYCCGWGEAIRAALPGVKERKSVERVRLTEAGRREAALEAAGLGLPGLEGGGSLRTRLLSGMKGRQRRIDSLAAAIGRGVRPEVERLIGEGLVEKVSAEEGGSRRIPIRSAILAAPPDQETREKLSKRAPRQAAVLEILENAEDFRLPLRDLEARAPGARAACAAMAKKGWIAFGEIEEKPEAPAPGAGEEEAPAVPDTLTPGQQTAFDTAAADIRGGKFSVTLLHGVTGSGKTEVYIRLAEEALRLGRGALVLVPEIGLTPQLMGRFRARFGGRVACLHSAFPDRRRAEEWRRVRSGEALVALGTRSAVFAPLPDIGFIAVDEEHDSSYKQEEAPRYSARDTAIVRARRAGVPVVLGSATPSMESYARARSGGYRLIELPGRPGGQPLPEVRLVDLRRERGGDPKAPPLLSHALSEAIAERLRRGEQTLLFLNRRGFSSVILCRDCGAAVECEHCSVPLTFHLHSEGGGGGRLRCHLCDLSARPPHQCPACGSDRIGYFGLGTERVEEAVRTRFPAARVRRMDRDTVRRAEAYDEILGAVRRGEVDILIGTQMVAKGHDFPKMTLVGVVLADVGLHLPDFRAGERTFQLLTQVAGRAGRAELPGEVIVQTFRPEHAAVAFAQTHDYAAFFEHESRIRSAAGYPPYRRLARLRFERRKKDAAARAGEWVRHFLDQYGARRSADAELAYLGPAPAMLSRVRGINRHHLLLKSNSVSTLAGALRALDEAFHRQKRFGNVQLVVDVNPQNLL